jgi:hypothetical protein
MTKKHKNKKSSLMVIRMIRSDEVERVSITEEPCGCTSTPRAVETLSGDFMNLTRRHRTRSMTMKGKKNDYSDY